MATITGSTSSSVWTHRLVVTEGSADIANNTSPLTVEVYIGRVSSSGSYMYGAKISGVVSVTGAGSQSYSYNNPNRVNIGAGEWLHIATVTFSAVPHDADGSKTVTVSDSFTNNINPRSGSASGSVTLTTIPRATTPTLSASSVDMGDTVTISTPRASSAFTHDLAYSFAGESYVTIATGVGTSYTWTVPDLATKIPNASSGAVTIRCITKNGSAEIGTKTVSLTARVPTSVVPTIGDVTLTEATEGLAEQFGTFISKYSKVAVAITAEGAKGSTIKSYSSTLLGKTYAGSSWTSDALTGGGDLAVVTTVTDSRGRTASKTTAFTALEYRPPEITAFRAYRCDADGEAYDDGQYIAVVYAYSVQPLDNKNTAAMEVEYKRSTVSAWSSLLSSTALSADETVKPTSPTFSTDYQYDLRISVTDWFGETGTYRALLPSGAVILDISADGLGLAFGKTSERHGVDFGWAAKGMVLGLGEATANIPSGADLNDYRTPGVYGIPNEEVATTLLNAPIGKAGTLRVYAATGQAVLSGALVCLIQEFRSSNVFDPSYRRYIGTDDTSTWEFGAWVSTWDTLAQTGRSLSVGQMMPEGLPEGVVNAATGFAVNGSTLDYIVDSGVTDGWTYRKWASGIIECWKREAIGAVQIANLAEYQYYSDTMYLYYPVELFKTVTHANISVFNNGRVFTVSNLWLYSASVGYRLMSSYRNETYEGAYVTGYIVGEWK